MFISYWESPIGKLQLKANEHGLTSCWFVDDEVLEHTLSAPILEEAEKQLTSYFEGELKSFELPLAPEGTDFQQKVWAALCEIPYGTTRSYLQLSLQLGDKNLTRAVGTANGRNPLGIIIPCHRVIGADGSLTGYAGGTWRKRALLKLEGAEQPTLFG